MDRRTAIKNTAILIGGAVSASTIAGLMKGCKTSPETTWVPGFLDDKQAAIITRMVDIIIPRTDTPGAIDVGVPGFIDSMVADVYSPEEQGEFVYGIIQFNQGSLSGYGDSFLELSADKQEAYLRGVHQQAIQQGGNMFMMKIKELTLIGFFTSEVGATKVLQYEAVPGSFQGCLPLKDVGKTWAT